MTLKRFAALGLAVLLNGCYAHPSQYQWARADMNAVDSAALAADEQACWKAADYHLPYFLDYPAFWGGDAIRRADYTNCMKARGWIKKP